MKETFTFLGSSTARYHKFLSAASTDVRETVVTAIPTTTIRSTQNERTRRTTEVIGQLHQSKKIGDSDTDKNHGDANFENVTVNFERTNWQISKDKLVRPDFKDLSRNIQTAFIVTIFKHRMHVL